MDQLAGLTEEARKLALERFRLLQPHLEDDRPLKAVATAAGISFRTAQRWVSQYDREGRTGLPMPSPFYPANHLTARRLTCSECNAFRNWTGQTDKNRPI